MHRARTLVLAGLIAILAVPAPALSAPLTGVEGIFHTVFQQDQSSFSGIGVRLHLKSAQLIENVTIAPSIQYWRNHSHVSSFDISSTRSDARLGADARYTFLQYAVQPWVGGGWGLHFLSSKVTAPALGLVEAEDSVVRGGMSLGAGVSTPIAGKLTNDFGLEYDFLGTQSQMKLNFGLRYRF
jgi:opacity protein-like surface antigen